MTSNFYATAATLDALKESVLPTIEQVDSCIDIIREPHFLRYFFHDLNNPNWLPPLAQAGIFQQPPAPEEAEPGYYRVPVWEASRYLVRVADRHPEIIVRIALAIHTDNFRVHSDLVDAALRTPAGQASIMEAIVANWLASRFSSPLPEKAADLMVYLAENEELEPAIDLLRALTGPADRRVDPQRADAEDTQEQGETRSRVDEYQLGEIVRGQVQVVAARYPDRVAAVLERQLVVAIYNDSRHDDDADPTRFSFWAEDAEADHSVHSLQGYKPLLLRGLRAVLYRAPEALVRLAAKRYVDHPYAVFRRLGIKLISSHLEQCVDLVQEVLSRQETLADDTMWPEISRLLETGFGQLPTAFRSELLDRISAGPPQNVIEREKRWYRESKGEDPPAEHMLKWVDDWILDHLWPLRNHDLPVQVRDQLVRLRTQHGEPAPPYRGVVSVSFAGPSTPTSKDELNDMAPMKVVDYLRAYVPQPTDWGFEPSRLGLAQALQEAVGEQPQRYAEVAPMFVTAGMRPIYAVHLLRGLEKAWESGKDFAWSRVLELIGVLARGEVAPVKDSDEQSQDEIDWIGVNRDIASLLEEGVRRDEHAVPDERMPDVRDILLRLVSQTDPLLDEISGSTLDPATQAINSGRGSAVQALIMYALRRARFLEEHAPTAVAGRQCDRFEPEVREALTERLDRGKETSKAVHSLFGKFLPQLRYLDRTWFEQNLARILPQGQEQEAYWQAAWCSYVAFNAVYSDLYVLLREHYRRAIESLSGQGDLKAGLESVADRLAGHVLSAYWGGLETLDEGGLVALLFRVAPAQGHGNIARMIQHRPMEGDQAFKNEVWPRLKALWESRIAAADKAPNPAEHRQELTEYFWWLKDTPAGLGELCPLIKRTLPYMQEGIYADLLVEYLQKQATTYPMLAVQVLLQMMTVGAGPLRYKQDEVTDILTMAMKSGDSDVRAVAIEVINLFGERGEYAYRGLLDL